MTNKLEGFTNATWVTSSMNLRFDQDNVRLGIELLPPDCPSHIFWLGLEEAQALRDRVLQLVTKMENPSDA